MKLFKITSEPTTYTDPPVVAYVVATTIQEAFGAAPGFPGAADIASIELICNHVIAGGGARAWWMA